MGTPGTGGRRRMTAKLHSAEEHALDIIAKEAEARLAARRAARAEAREIRMKELEKQQKEADQQSDRHFEMLNEPVRGIRQTVTRTGSHGSSYAGSRRSSEDSTDMDSRDGRDIRHQLADIEDKFRKAMITNAQMDNDKTSLTYQVDMLKDELEEIEENFLELQKDYKEKCREFDLLRKDGQKLQEDVECLKFELEQREKLITEHGLVVVCAEDSERDENCEMSPISKPEGGLNKVTLVSQEAAMLLEQAGEGSLDVRLKRFAEEKQDLLDQIRRLNLDLEEERQKNAKMEKLVTGSPQTNGPDMKILEMQRETNKQINEYKFKLQKAEQEVTTLQSNVTRLENQVSRYKATSEASEKTEDELKAEKRKLLREYRDAQCRIEELETANNHLQKRIDKLKSRNTPLK